MRNRQVLSTKNEYANFGWQMRLMDSCAGWSHDLPKRIEILETGIKTAPKWITQKTKDQIQTTIDWVQTRMG